MRAYTPQNCTADNFISICFTKLFSSELQLTPLPHNQNFLQPYGRRRFKELWEKEKVMDTSIFSFFLNYFLSKSNRHFSDS